MPRLRKSPPGSIAPKLAAVLVAAASLAGPPWPAAPAHAASGASGLYYERALMLQAGGRCRLFAPEIASALAASAAQARGAALVAGDTSAALEAVRDRAAATADRTPCASPDLATAAERVRKAFVGYAHLQSQRFPGAIAGWDAERGRSTDPAPRWRIAELAAADGALGVVTAGLVATGRAPAAPELVVTAEGPAARKAVLVRLLVRDPARASGAYLDLRSRKLQTRAAPADVCTVFLSRSRGPAPASLIRIDATALMATFPPEAIAAMQRLDPREAATVEYVALTAGADHVWRAYVEVGDLEAARAFVAAAPVSAR